MCVMSVSEHRQQKFPEFCVSLRALTGHTLQGWYLIEKTWFNNLCKDSGLDANIRLALQHKCVPGRSTLVL